MDYNTKCICCNWKFIVDDDYKDFITCVKCGSTFK